MPADLSLFPKADSRIATQEAVVGRIQPLVDAWRGFPLGPAQDPYPDDPPDYAPAQPWEREISTTTRLLLTHWFRHEPHVLRDGLNFKYWPHQRRTVETFIYLHEVCGLRRSEELWRLAGGEPRDVQRDPWAKLGAELATGSGKTKVMSLLIAWAYLNAVRQGESYLGLGRHSLVIAPGHFVRERLLADFRPDEGPSVFEADPVVPPDLRNLWQLRVYGHETCPLKLDPSEGALVVTNIHKLTREDEEVEEDLGKTRSQKQVELLFGMREPRKLEDTSTPLLDRFTHSRGLLVINDEAHRVGDEPSHRREEMKARGKGDGASAAGTSWINSLQTLNGGTGDGRLGLQVDLSATLFEEEGKARTRGDLFRHTVVRYELIEAKRDGIIKQPVLEKVAATQDGQAIEPVDPNAPNAWAQYQVLIETGIERWKKVRGQMKAEGDGRKPILLIIAENKDHAAEIANFLTYEKPVNEPLEGTPTGWRDARTGERLFLDGNGGSTVVQVHIGEKELRNEKEWSQIRRVVNLIDRDRIPGEERGTYVDNPYNVIVSVLMLREGWDVRGVKVIVPCRKCDSRTLTEQVLGRGLRKMHPPVIDDDGAVSLGREELYVIEHPSFREVLKDLGDLVEEQDSDKIDHTPAYLSIAPRVDDAQRVERDVRLVRYLGETEDIPDWRRAVNVHNLPQLSPRIPWVESPGVIDVRTFLIEAGSPEEEEGLHFRIDEEPTYRDFEQVLAKGYAEPLLKELGAGFHHRTAVKGLVRDFLERKTFALPGGVRPTFDLDSEPSVVRAALANLCRPEVTKRVRAALLPVLKAALESARPVPRVQLQEEHAHELPGYPAIRSHVLENTRRSPFVRQAMGNNDELRVARWIDLAPDVAGWVYNHRRAPGFRIEYVWRDLQVPYFPDFVIRTREGGIPHNWIVEVKGRLDDRDKAKAMAGVEYCSLLTRYDNEPWHYLFLLENDKLGRTDVTECENAADGRIYAALLRQERHGVLPGQAAGLAVGSVEIVPSVPEADKFRAAVPAYDLVASGGPFGSSQTPEPLGWIRLSSSHRPDRRSFAAKVAGKSMEPGVPDGSWCLFRGYPAGEAPSIMALSGRRVVMQLHGADDPETGGRFALKRLRVVAVTDGAVCKAELVPDNPAFKPMVVDESSGDLRVVAELVDVLG